MIEYLSTISTICMNDDVEFKISFTIPTDCFVSLAKTALYNPSSLKSS
jgi:hypothetical protein